MTVHARGYRPFTGAVRTRGPRFVTIFRQGYADATRGRGFRVFQVIVLVIFVLIAILLNFQVSVGRGLGSLPRRGTPIPSDAELARTGLATALMWFHTIAMFPVVLLTLFVGAGLVADDLRTRALPLYLVRPVTPFDYFLGKWLVPVAVLAVNVLAPGLGIVLMAAVLRPSGESTAFLAEQGDIVGTLLAHFAVLALVYASVVILVSAAAKRRGAAIIAGALVFIGGSIVGGGINEGISEEMEGVPGDVARALSPMGDAFRVLDDGIGHLAVGVETGSSGTGADGVYVAAAVLLALCAFVVMRRARTTEVVS